MPEEPLVLNTAVALKTQFNLTYLIRRWVWDLIYRYRWFQSWKTRNNKKEYDQINVKYTTTDRGTVSLVLRTYWLQVYFECHLSGALSMCINPPLALHSLPHVSIFISCSLHYPPLVTVMPTNDWHLCDGPVLSKKILKWVLTAGTDCVHDQMFRSRENTKKWRAGEL